MKSLNVSKVSLMFLGLVSLCLNVVQAVQRPIFYNHPRVFVPGQGTIRAGSIDKLSPDGTRSTVVSDLGRPSGIAFDAAGNLYYGNVTSGSIRISLFKRTLDGIGTNLGEVVDTSGWSGYFGGWGFDVAVSPSGDVFYNHPMLFSLGTGTIRHGSIEKLSPDGMRSTVVSGLDDPSGIAFDAAGNLYYGNVARGSIRVSLFKRTRDGTVTNLGEVVDTSGGSVSVGGWGFDVAVSPSGDILYNHPRVFVGEGTIRPGSIDKLSPEGTRSTVVSGLDNPSGIALDAAGNLYFGNRTSGSIRISLFKRTLDGIVTNLGEVVNTSGGWVSGVGWGFDVAIGPAIMYVDADAVGANDGSSWENAFNYLQDALDVASSSDEVWVAQGIYKPDEDSAHPNGTGSRTATFQLKNGVPIKGGYAGFGEPDPNAQDIEVYETVLSGDLLGNDGPDFANNGENSYHVVTGSGTDETAVLDGFTITAGNASIGGPPVPPPQAPEVHTPYEGGGIYNYAGSPTLTNCTFTDNLADFRGGGMYNELGSPTVTNCIFSGNSAQGQGAFAGGGGMYNYSGSPTVTNCTFSTNSANRGGGMRNWESSPTLTDCTFSGNSAGNGGGGMSNREESSPTVTNCTFTGNWAVAGGGMHNSYSSSPTVTNCTFTGNWAVAGGGMHNSYSSSPTLTNCTFTGNSAKGRGGGIYNAASSPILTNCTFSGNSSREHGGGMQNFGKCSPILTSCTFSDNTAQYCGGGIQNHWSNTTLINCTFIENVSKQGGGGMHNYECNPLLTNCTFSRNSAGDGGGVYNAGGAPMLTNCIFRGNWVENYGGGMGGGNSSPTLTNCAFSGNSAGAGGGGMYNSGGNPTLSSCTFSDNLAQGNGGGMSSCYGGSATVTNCILWGNTAPSGPQIYLEPNIDASVSYSDVEGGWLGIGNINADPLFVDPAIGDYHLLPDSPCINAGDPNYAAEPNETDLDGKPRVIGGRIDMGAYEYANTAPVACIVDGNRIVECGGCWGARVTLDSSCSSDADSTAGTNDDIVSFDWYKVDACDPNFEDFLARGEIIDCNLPLGEHIIVLEVIDKADAFDTNEVTIIVQDTTPPMITLNGPATMTLECGVNSYTEPDATATDICDGDVPVIIGGDTVDTSTCGTYVVTYDATDASGNAAEQVTRAVVVQDTIPPAFALSVTPTTLWPANHKMVLITPTWTASDICDDSPEVSLVNITMNEGDEAKGDGHTAGDIQIGDDGSIRLRAERSGSGSGRIYTITYQAVDDSGNAAVASATVTVPHDQR